MSDKINKDGSIEGKTFSGDKFKGQYPTPRYGTETYREYRTRVRLLADEEHFNVGDLSWSDWDIYCKGSGSYDGFDADLIIMA